MSYEDIAFKIGYLKAREEELKFLKRILILNKPTKEKEGVYYWNDKIAIKINDRIKLLSKLEDDEIGLKEKELGVGEK